jgi:MscS family membrane protein
MKELLQHRILDNTIEAYAYVFGTILLALIVKRFISNNVASVIYRSITKIGTTVEKKHFLNLVVKPLDLFLVLLVSFIAFERLNYPKLWKLKIYKINLQHIIDSITIAVLIITFFWVVLRIIDFIAMVLEEKASISSDQSTNQLVVFFKDFFKVLILIIGVLLLLRFSFHQNIGNLLTGLSLVGAAIALATRESLENLIASFIIFFDKPFVTGNAIRVENFAGTVEKIGLRSTRVRTDQKTYITIPNKKMVDSVLDNLTLRTQRKVDTRLELGLSTTADQIKEIIAAVTNILKKEAVEETNVFLAETGQQAHVVLVEYFTNAFQENKAFLQLRQEINLEIVELLDKMNIEMAAKKAEVIVQAVPSQR